MWSGDQKIEQKNKNTRGSVVGVIIISENEREQAKKTGPVMEINVEDKNREENWLKSIQMEQSV